MNLARMNFRIQMAATLSGPLFTLLTLVGWLGLAQGLMPIPAHLSPEETLQRFVDNQDGMKLGCMIYIIACAFFTLWIAQLGAMLNEIKWAPPALNVAQVTAGNAVAAFVMLSCCLWIGAAYRPQAHPDVTVALNDAAWLGFLLTWPSLALQMICTGLMTLMDDRAEPLTPRWVSKVSIVSGVLICTASGPAFAKAGPFAWNGALAYYIPMLIWGLWFELHSWYMVKALLRQHRGQVHAAVAAA